MRPIYLCIGCAATYLPPENPTSGQPASPAHCGLPSCQEAVRQAVAMSGLPEERLGELARRAIGVDGERRLAAIWAACGLAGEPPVTRGRRPVRGRRAAAAPGGGRSRLR